MCSLDVFGKIPQTMIHTKRQRKSANKQMACQELIWEKIGLSNDTSRIPGGGGGGYGTFPQDLNLVRP